MGTVERSVEVNVPLSVAYNQWTQFQDFPRFMEGVEEIRQVHDHHLYWRVNLAGVTREFHAEIVEQRPDERVAWRSSEGAMHAGVVSFHRVGPSCTKIDVRIEEEPAGVSERLGEDGHTLDRRVEGDLGRFKRMMESRDGWQAEIERLGGRFERAAEAGGRAVVPPRGGR
jgi:uncharacterized membrane protein